MAPFFPRPGALGGNGPGIVNRPMQFVAPQLLTVQGSPLLPGIVRWATAFTTAAPDWPSDWLGASHLHRCNFASVVNEQGRLGPVEWQVETRPFGQSPFTGLPVTQGETLRLPEALVAAVAAACRLPEATDPRHRALLLQPAFVAFGNTPGIPGLWGSAGLMAEGIPGTPDMQAVSRTCFIRERYTDGTSVFVCSLEEDAVSGASHTAAPPAHWLAPSLPVAVSSGCNVMLHTVPATTPPL